jgi:hypothetical protein
MNGFNHTYNEALEKRKKMSCAHKKTFYLQFYIEIKKNTMHFTSKAGLTDKNIGKRNV